MMYGGLNQEYLFMENYLDSDRAGDKKSQKLTSSFIFILNGDPISWWSKKQPTIALLSGKVKYITFTLATKKTT